MTSLKLRVAAKFLTYGSGLPILQTTNCLLDAHFSFRRPPLPIYICLYLPVLFVGLYIIHCQFRPCLHSSSTSSEDEFIASSHPSFRIGPGEKPPGRFGTCSEPPLFGTLFLTYVNNCEKPQKGANSVSYLFCHS